MPAVIFKMQQGSVMFCCWFSDSGVEVFVKINEMMNSEKYHYENTISAVKTELQREHSGAPSFMDRPPQSSTLYYYYYYYYY